MTLYSLSFSSLQDTEDSLRTVASLHPSCTLQGSVRRASPVNTSSHRLSGGGWSCWTGFGPDVCAREGQAPCLSSALQSTWRLQQRVGRYQRKGLSTAPVRASQVLCCACRSPTVHLSPIDHLQPRRFAFRRRTRSNRRRRNALIQSWRSTFVERQWLCPPQGRATYTAEPPQWTRLCCCSSWPIWELWLSSNTSVGMRDWNFSSCSGLARFFSR